MTPSLSTNDAADVGLRCAKAHRQINLARAFGVEVSDHLDFSLTKAGVMVATPENRTNVSTLASEHVEAVPNVIGKRDNLQVLDPVVMLHAVDVIDLHSFGDKANESSRDKTVNLHVGMSLPTIVEANATVPALVPVSSEPRSARTRNLTVSGHSVARPPIHVDPLSHQPTPTVYSVGGFSLE